MKHFLASLMILALLASTLVCVCGHEAQAASPTHSHHSHYGHSSHDGDGPAFKHDCKGADMQLPQQASVSNPDLKSSFHADYILTDIQPAWTSLLASEDHIRGPPPNWPDTSRTHPSILLTTQRLLI